MTSPDQFVVVTRYAPEGKRTITHAFGPFDDRNAAAVFVRKLKAQARENDTDEQIAALTYGIHKVQLPAAELEIEVDERPSYVIDGKRMTLVADAPTFEQVLGIDQRSLDLETVQKHLERGRRPWTPLVVWGPLEWALSRLLDLNVPHYPGQSIKPAAARWRLFIVEGAEHVVSIDFPSRIFAEIAAWLINRCHSDHTANVRDNNKV